MYQNRSWVFFVTMFFIVAANVFAADINDTKDPTLVLNIAAPGRPVSTTFYGLMTEEINHSYDGGLYAELIRNRAFLDDTKTPTHWSAVQHPGGVCSIALDESQPVNASLPNSLRLDVTKVEGQTGIANDGFWGIPVKPNTAYKVSFFAKVAANTKGSLTVAITNDEGATGYPQVRIEGITDQWKRYTVTLQSGNEIKPSKNNHFVISASNPGTYWFSLVSMLPPTWHDRPNGCRIDLMQLMADLKPTFLRCPGGNYLEGNSVDNRFQWKNTLGDISGRHGHMGCWNYRSSDGMGLLEFLEWSEDIGADPVLAVYGGFSLPTRPPWNGTTVTPGAELKPFVDEAIEEIEYATGDIQTKWGRRRAADGHPMPFHISYVEIGNEDFNGNAQKTYEARFAQFYDALKAVYPRLKLIATIPIKNRTPDVVDDHYYLNSDQMAALAHQYDNVKRDGPKVFVGEWATREIPKADQSGNVTFVTMPWVYQGVPTPTLHAALGDAAFMTGLERNADVVVMNCYAPMLTRVDPGAAQWCPNMIGYDALQSFGSPSYYVQQMFNLNLGDVIIDAKLSGEVKDCFYSATRSTVTGTVYLKVVNRSPAPLSIPIALDGLKTISPDGDLIQLTSNDPLAVNSIEEPNKVVPITLKVHGLGPRFTQTFPGNSLSVLKIKM